MGCFLALLPAPCELQALWEPVPGEPAKGDSTTLKDLSVLERSWQHE